MQSPTALEEYQDDAAANPRTTPYSTAHPTGTGPFKFDAWDRGRARHPRAQRRLLGRRRPRSTRPSSWRSPTRRPAPTRCAPARSTATTWSARPTSQPLEDEGFQVVNRPAFNILYLGMNQKGKPLDDPKVRQAIAHAINKDEVVSASLPEGTKSRHRSSCPTWSTGYDRRTSQTYDYDPEKAKQLLAEAGATGADDRVQLPDRGHPAVHALAGGHLQRDPLAAGGGRPQDQADRRPVEPGLPGEDPGHRQARPAPARLDRRLQRHRQLHRRLLRTAEQTSGASTTRSSSTR